MRSPVTIVIPVLLIVLTVITSFIMYKQNVESTDKNIRAYALQELKLDVTRLQNILYNLLTENKLAEARVNLSITAMNPAMQSLVLTDETNTIIAANRYLWNNSAAKNVVDYNDKLANDVKRTNKPLIFFHENESHILQGYYPVVLKLESKDSLSRKKLGILFAEVNIENKLLNAQNKALNQSMTFAGSMLATSFFIAVLLHLLVSRRLKILASAAQNIAKGNFDTTVSVSGNDEITHLAESYNQMIFHINKAFALRDSSKAEIVSLNEKLEERIQERTKLLKQAQHIAQIGNWVWYVEENSLYWSDEVYQICGVELGNFILTYEGFLNVVHPKDVAMVEQGIEDAFKNNANYKVEHRIILPNGEVRWVREEAIPEVDSDGKRIKMTGILQDITNQKNDIKEKEKLERELQQMQKMESLGQLTGGIAHDFNNMLAIILGYNELAQVVANSTDNEQLKKYLEQIEISSRRASDLIGQMLAFSRIDDVTKKENISLISVLSEIGFMLKPLLSSSIVLNVLNTDMDFIITADTAMLNQVIINLCLNAKDAMPDKQGQIDIEVSHVTLDNINCSSCFNPIAGEFIQISIKDDGSGMSKEALQRIFEPFFTTKEVGEGTGMGLAMVHGIMHKHQGHLIVESIVDLGSTFKLLFPMLRGEQKNTLIKNDVLQRGDVSGCEGNILIVDDEVAVSLFLKEYLEDKGYKAAVINDSREALEYFIKNNKNIELVISDYTMPGLTGFQLAQYMLTYDPDMPIILCSGYSEDINKDKALSANIKTYIEKPINTDLLLAEIRKYIRTQKYDD